MKKTKQTKTKKTVRSARRKIKHYPTEYLAIALAAVLIIEGIMMGSTNLLDWNSGIQLLDVSTAFEQTVDDSIIVFQPMIEVVANVDQFYQLATTEMIALLDLEGSAEQMQSIIGGVNDFYQFATLEMMYILDSSNISSWPGSVSGISISVE